MIYGIILVAAIFLNIFFRNLFSKLNIVNNINPRSSHTVKATSTGGSVLFCILLVYSLYLYIIGSQPYDFSIFIPISILFVTGLYDDIYNVDFGLKFIFQIIVAKILIDLGFVIDIFSLFGYEYEFSRIISQIITIFIFLALINAYNFIDGIDLNIHLETIKNLLILIFLFSYSQTIKSLIIFSIIIMLVNLIFNINKKVKVFMGDSGSLIIPLIITVFLFEGIAQYEDQNIIKFLIIIFLYPLFDLIRVVIIRILNKKSPFQPDKNHIHHHLDRLFNSHVKSSLLIFITTLCIQILFIATFIK